MRARAHLAESTMLQMAVQPHIIHIVGHTEAHHAATADEVIESALMVQEVVETALCGSPDMTGDPQVQQRKAKLVEETHLLLDAIRGWGNITDAPMSDPITLSTAMLCELLDAPQVVDNAKGTARIHTHSIEGAARIAQALDSL